MNEPVHTFRLATPDDAEALLKIYEPYIATTVTNETQVPALGEFRQRIVDGQQVELPDSWLSTGEVWQIPAMDETREVKIGGTVDTYFDDNGKLVVNYHDYTPVLAVPYDMPIVGYGNHVVNTLRVWDAKPITDFKLDEFDRGNYHKAVEQENLAKLIVDVLYPNDNHYSGKELRLKQQYFFISASLQTMLEKYKKDYIL